MGSINKYPGIYIRRGKYILDKVYKGQRIHRTIGSVDDISIEDADTELTAEKYRIDNPSSEIPETRIESNSLTVEDALDYLWEQRLKHKDYAKDIRHILTSVNRRLGSKLVKQVKRSDIENYIRLRLKDKKRNRVPGTVSPRTVQKELQHLNMALNLLVDDGNLDKNHIKSFTKVKQNRSKPKIIDEGSPNGSQWQLLHKHIAPNMRPILLTLYETGMRPKEVFNMRWSWLEQKSDDQWIIRVPAVDVVNGETVFEEKTNNEREIPVSPPLLRCLQDLGIKSEQLLIFPAPRKKGPRTDIESAFTNALKRAELTGQGISPYVLRRTRLTIWDQIDPAAGMYAAGHVSKDVHYRHYVNFPLKRLFKLVGIDYEVEDDLKSPVTGV